MSATDTNTSVFGATLSRRGFVKGGGALIVGLSVAGAGFGAKAAKAAAPTPDPSQIASWLEIHADNTILIRTGIPEMGQGSVTGSFKQIVAEELNVPYEAITEVVSGDTDRTPDGGLAAGLTHKIAGSPPNEALGKGALNLQKVAAYTYQALLGLASTQLGVPAANLSVTDGVVSGGGKSITYGQLVAGNALKLTIPYTGAALTSNLVVTGAPPTKPVAQYAIVGKSYPMSVIPGIVSGASTWVGNIRLPGLLQGQMVKPPTPGSTLISVGKLDKKRFPTSQLVVKGNLVGVLSPNQWEAIAAAQSVASTTKWTAWSGLEGSGNLPSTLRKADYSKNPTITGASAKGSVPAGIAGAAKTLSATYFTPYVKHGPIGPSITVADVRSDGMVYIYAHTQKPQSLRSAMATMLGTTPDKVVVRVFDGAGHYGRSNGGIEGSEADAVVLSQLAGKPVMVQWLRPEDMQWATSSPATLSDVTAGLDAAGNIVAFQADYHAPGTADERPVGAVLSGMNHGPEPAVSMGISTNWIYNNVPNVVERGSATMQLGQATSPLNIGFRPHSMRTPNQRQQNFALEGMINEAAAAAGADPIAYRLRHTTDVRMTAVLNTLRDASGWETRPSPSPKARSTGSGIVTGQGMCVMLRSDANMGSVAKISVDLKSGKIAIDDYTAVVEPGIVLNPRQLERVFVGGTVQGISEALMEEVAFDRSKATSIDWVTYPIMRFTSLPPIKVVILNRADLNVVGGGSEPPNALALASIAAAFFDATGKQARSLPLRPARVRELLKA
jgi:CO/xanthine dehydrogenase Mo-binding subunit